MRTTVLATTAVLCLAAGPAAAGTQTNFLDIHYIASSIETGNNTDRDSDLGFGFTLTKSFWEHAAWVAEIDWRDFEDDGPELDVITASVGAGPQLAIEQLAGLEVFAAASLEHMRSRLQNDDPTTADRTEVTSIQNNGIGAQLGLSFPLLETVELFARYKFIDFTDADNETLEDETIVRVGARYAFTEEVSALLSYETYDEQEIDELRLGIGLSFD